ncbi:hypothetical protein CRENBAI_026010 [Crenichthys baileyi]|uniref:Uncharacterized protein n=1 Tax=Crenichthys baileyi TaxID=28760 RepID=A0AAV9RZA2_9TELE
MTYTNKVPKESNRNLQEHSNRTNLSGMQRVVAPGRSVGDGTWRRSPCKTWQRCLAPSRKLPLKWPPEAPRSWQPMRKGLTLPRAHKTDIETVSPTNGCHGADIHLKRSDRAKRLRGGTRIKTGKPERQNAASHCRHLWNKGSISPQCNTGAIRVPTTTWLRHKQSMQFPYLPIRGHGQQEGGFQGEPLEIHPRNWLKWWRLKGHKHQQQIPRRGHRAPRWTNIATTEPDTSAGNG